MDLRNEEGFDAFIHDLNIVSTYHYLPPLFDKPCLQKIFYLGFTLKKTHQLPVFNTHSSLLNI